MTLLILYVLLALGVSFLCSIMEAVLLSVSPSYVAMQGQQGHSVATELKKLKKDIDRPLAAILSLNTIAHTVGATGAGAQAVAVFGDAYVGVISAVLTLLILVISEIIPKTIGAVYWRTLTPWVVRILVPIIWCMWPLVKLSKVITVLLSPKDKEASISREEITALAELGKEEGVFEEGESRILKNLFRFRSLRVRDVMTPRTVVFALPEKSTVGSVLEDHGSFRFSRLPVYRENKDDVKGYVLTDDLLLKAAQNDDLPLSELKREIEIVPIMLPLPDLLERFLETGEHIALVIDEYGGMAGVVTLEDVIETLLGLEIVDEADSVEDMQALARQQWLNRARRLGIVDENDDPTSDAAKRDAAIRLGLTGSAPPED